MKVLFDYENVTRIFFLLPGAELGEGLQPIEFDKDVTLMGDLYAAYGSIHIYVEHAIDDATEFPLLIGFRDNVHGEGVQVEDEGVAVENEGVPLENDVAGNDGLPVEDEGVQMENDQAGNEDVQRENDEAGNANVQRENKEARDVDGVQDVEVENAEKEADGRSVDANVQAGLGGDNVEGEMRHEYEERDTSGMKENVKGKLLEFIQDSGYFVHDSSGSEDEETKFSRHEFRHAREVN